MATGDWLFIWLGIAIAVVYELHFRVGAQQATLRLARATHARLRAAWVLSLMQAGGQELLAVQTIRNSVLSATVTASSAVLALTAVVALAGGRPAAATDAAALGLTPAALLVALLVVVLCATFAFSAMALRFFNHAGYLMTTQAEGETRERLAHMACNYMMRAGNYYSMGLRTLFWLAPVAVGLVNTRLVPLLALAIVAVLVWFDRTPEQLEGVLPGEGKP
jgi:uncharacterized membrane protein